MYKDTVEHLLLEKLNKRSDCFCFKLTACCPTHPFAKGRLWHYQMLHSHKQNCVKTLKKNQTNVNALKACRMQWLESILSKTVSAWFGEWCPGLPCVCPPDWWYSWLSCSSHCVSGTWGTSAALQGPGCPSSCWLRLRSPPSGNCGSGSEALASVHWISWEVCGKRKKEKDTSSNTNGLTRSGDKQVLFNGTAILELVVIVIS